MIKVNQSTIMDLQLGDIKKINFPFPSIVEQQKIADFLTSVDKRIELLEKKKTLLETYKKGVMKKIFNQEIRFKDDNGNDFPDWEEKKMEEISNITTGRLDANAMVDGGQYRFYTCAKDYYHIDNFSFDTDALIISGNGANVGYIHHYKGKFNAYQRTYVLDGFQESILYVKYFLDRFLKSRIESEKKEGSTPYIVKSTLADMIIKLPSLSEQIKISDFLSSIDTQLKLLDTQINKSKTWKKGLLQKMFV
jgi:type I restriction enzyme S subunit